MMLEKEFDKALFNC